MFCTSKIDLGENWVKLGREKDEVCGSNLVDSFTFKAHGLWREKAWNDEELSPRSPHRSKFQISLWSIT